MTKMGNPRGSAVTGNIVAVLEMCVHWRNEVYLDIRHQRYWVHKTANVLNKLPKSATAPNVVHDV